MGPLTFFRAVASAAPVVALAVSACSFSAEGGGLTDAGVDAFLLAPDGGVYQSSSSFTFVDGAPPGSDGGGASSSDGFCLSRCSALKFTCGVTTDSCGHLVSCGACGANEACLANVCVLRDHSAGVDAGFASSSSSATSESSGPVIIGSSSIPGSSSSSTCASNSCGEFGYDCGSISDGCGNTLDCGTCNLGETCTDNVCGPPPPSADAGETGPLDCMNPTPEQQACEACVQSACQAQWLADQANCAAFNACFAECDCSNDTCLTNCADSDLAGACGTALENVTNCETSDCASSCSGSTTSSSASEG